jgi:hypothetical protein
MFKGLHAALVRQIDWCIRIKPVDKVLMARKHQIPQWLRSGLLELVTRDEGLQTEELQALGWETSARLMKLREKRIAESFSNTKSSSSSSSTEKVPRSKVIEDSFSDELAQIDVDYNNFYASDV